MSPKSFRPWYWFILLLFIAGVLSPVELRAQPDVPPDDESAQIGGSTEVEPLVWKELEAEGSSDFFIWMTEQADLSPAYQLATKEERGNFVFETLRQTAVDSQADLLSYLDAQGVTYRPFYISNKILVRGGDEALLTSVAARPDVDRITANHLYQLEEPAQNSKAEGGILAIEPNLTFVNADDVWALGITGENTVLAGLDTGLDWTHPAIIDHYRGWDGTAVDHNYNWWDATGLYPTAPGDGHSHGTHTTGTMVGDDGGDNRIGMAPGARTIHCKGMDDFGGGSDATFSECFEWNLAPWDLNGENPRPDLAPDAINNSWGFPGGFPAFEDEVLALQAAGILVEASAGNSGPSCGTLGSPGDYGYITTTGSVSHAGGTLPGTLTFFSSRGGSVLYPDEAIPDIMAPGENVRSSVPGGGYANFSGTSMSGPHVTGLIGLMWSANPGLRGLIPETQQIMAMTAVPLTGQNGSNCGGDYVEGPNNDWGYGTIDALAAVEAAMAYGDPGTLAGTVSDAATGNPLEGATVEAVLDADLTWKRITDEQGMYSMPVFSGTYTVSAQTYGYFPETIYDVEVSSFTTTTVDLALEPAPVYTVDGFVRDAVTSWPLYASIEIDGYPGDPVWTDPETGAYSIDLAAGVAYTFNVVAWDAGYETAVRTMASLTGDQTEDFDLSPDLFACTAPGYLPEFVYFEDFEDDAGGFLPDGGLTSWAWGMPTNGPGAARSGDNVWATSLSGNYFDNEFGYVVSPEIDLSAYADETLILSWWQWLRTEQGFDFATVEISNDGGTSWSLAYGPVAGDVSLQWSKQSIVLDPTFAVSNFRVRFGLSSDFVVNFPGFYVDDIGIGVAAAAPVLYAEDFEAGDGSYASDGSNSSWAWGIPTRGPGSAHSGENAWATDLNDNYNNEEDSVLTSPDIDLTGAPADGQLQLSWWQWSQTESLVDVVGVEVSGDGGASWSMLYSFSGPTDLAWTEYSIILDGSYAVENFRIRFTLQTDESVTYPGFYVDDITVSLYSDAPPTAPCNAQAGGLVKGYVNDANTGESINGATVTSDEGALAISSATPLDTAVADGFYTLFAPVGDVTLTASAAGYGNQEQLVTMTADTIIWQDFALPAGLLAVTPDTLAATVDLGEATTLSLELENGGETAVAFELREVDSGFTPASFAQVEIPAYQADASSSTETYADDNLVSRGSWLYQPSANALYTNATADVLLVAAGEASQIQAILQAYPDINLVDYFDGRVGTPALEQLQAYNSVIVMANNPFADPVALGDVLADYLDSGGSVVQTVPTFFDPGGIGWGLQGRFIDEGYSPFTGTGDWFTPADLGEFDPLHPIMQGVTSANDALRQIVELTPDSELVASWTDDEFVATKGSVVALNTFIVDGSGWTGDIDLIVHNSVIWLQTAGDVPWLATEPVTGTVEALSAQSVAVTFDAGVAEVLQPGTYEAGLRVVDDTPYDLDVIPVSMMVNAPPSWGNLSGVVTGLAYCDGPAAPIADALLIIDGAVELTADDDGSYSWWLEEGTHTLSAAADGYVSETIEVTVAAGETTATDFALRLDAPCTAVSPEAFTVELAAGDTTASDLTLSNSGAGDLTYAILESSFRLGTGLLETAERVEVPVLRTPEEAVDLFTTAVSAGPLSVQSMPAAAGKPEEINAPMSNWFAGADIPGGILRYGHAQCDEQPDSFYVISGVSTSGISDKTWRYDAADNVWHELAPIPMGQEGPTAVCHQGRIYVMGGGGSNQFYIYDIVSDSWLAGSALPRNVWGAAAGAWNGKVYLIGGDDDFFVGNTSAEVNIYDISSDSWSETGASMPVAALTPGFVQAGPYLYLAGGWNDASPAANLTAAQRYDMGSDSWETGPTMNFPRADLALAMTSQALYAIGGDADAGSFFDASTAVTRLDLADWPNGAWAELDDELPVATTANNAGFCTSGFYPAQVWSVGGMQNFFVTGVNRFLGLADETCYSVYEDVPWLDAMPAAETVSAGDEAVVTVTFDASGLTEGTYEATLVLVTNDPVTPQRHLPVTLTVAGPVKPPQVYLSLNIRGVVDGFVYADEDILAFNPESGTWSLYFDGSDVGLRPTNVDALALLEDGSLLLSFSAASSNVPGLGRVDDSDIVQFVPSSLGEETAGSFNWFLDGSDVGLSSNGEDIDAISFTADGRLLISTLGSFSVAGLTGHDEDMLVLSDAGFGSDSSGSWEIYFDGSDIALEDASEDIWGAWLDAASGDIYLTTQGAFDVDGANGDGLDLFICSPDSLGEETACSYSFFWDGSANGLTRGTIDALALAD